MMMIDGSACVQAEMKFDSSIFREIVTYITGSRNCIFLSLYLSLSLSSSRSEERRVGKEIIMRSF